MKKMLTAALALLLCYAGNVRSQKSWTDEEASAIIGYGNQLIGLYNVYLQIHDNIVLARSTYTGNRETLMQNPDAPVLYMGCDNFLNLNARGVMPLMPSWYPDKTVATDFADVQKINGQILAHCEAIQKYLDSKEFIRDKFAESDRLTGAMERLWDSAYVKMYDAVQRASALSGEAEMLLLQKSPLKHLVIPMKQDLNAMLKVIQSLGTTRDRDYGTLFTELAEMKAVFEKNKSTEGKDFSMLDVYYKIDVYPAFYRNLINALLAVESYLKLEKAGDGGEAGNEEATQILEQIYSYYNSSVATYNTFIGSR